MKKIVLFIVGTLCTHVLMAQVYISDLSEGWHFKQAQEEAWKQATVPGCVHTDLMDNGVVEDPFYRVNEKNLQWIGEKDWVYQKSIEVDKTLLSNENINLVFEGLDTYADVYVNDELVLTTDNMHRTWKVDVKPYIKEGDNTLRIYFHSVFKRNIPKYLEAPFKLAAWDNNDQSDIWLSLYSRKAGFHFGWDWGPRLLTAGIWRPVYLEAWSNIKIEDVQIIQKEVLSKLAKLSAVYEIQSDKDVTATILVKSGKTIYKRQTVKLKKGINTIPVDFQIKKPRLWWTNGLGEANLYDIECSVSAGSNTASKTISTGIRSLKVIRQKDKDGQSMYVELNGVPVFMKGANYIPLHNFQNKVSREKYEYYINTAVQSNMNMLRVWGGGIYEDDYFYELCDKNGLLVWQDIMFACGMFPVNDAFVHTVQEEVKDNVRRLRNHACIALWNGNNENEISWYGWGWKQRYTDEQQAQYEKNLNYLFYDVIPNAIKEADTTHYYHPTSPNTGYNGIPLGHGDVHYWNTKGKATLETYNTQVGRFMSEYGFQSYPELKSIKKFTKKKDRYKTSEVMFAHNRARHDQTRDPNFGNNVIERKMKDYYQVPKNFEAYVYKSQLLHAKATKIAIESHRRHMPFCMGTLYWQLNDCWPAVSWATTDFYGTWKAAQYMAREVNKNIAISAIEENGQLNISVISDELKDIKGQLRLSLKTFDGKVISEEIVPTTLAANTSAVYASKDIKELLGEYQLSNVVLEIAMSKGKQLLDNELFYFAPEKKLKLQQPGVKATIEQQGNAFVLTFNANALAKNIYLVYADVDGHFSDNYFDLLPGETKRITFTPNQVISGDLGLPLIKSLIDFKE
ncbi:MAG: glycoside hydrolase family 2 protein [Bacteroidales bacterium]|nr:glycoside hydrolase family 2 protein [Bacteroidales bacterium]